VVAPMTAMTPVCMFMVLALPKGYVGPAPYAPLVFVIFSPGRFLGRNTLSLSQLPSAAHDRANKRRVCLAARNTSEITHTMINSTRTLPTAATESPSPVQSAMYAARHIGHFGISARIAPGIIQPAILPLRRATLQQPRSLTCAPPPPHTGKLRIPATP
jgi:hypothetical protein